MEQGHAILYPSVRMEVPQRVFGYKAVWLFTV
ncbi:uncharacterized protein METZ01_LOCUS246506, partial [marine metagenome]